MTARRKLVTHEGTIGGVISDAFNILEELAGEMREEAEGLLDEVENMLMEAESVEFPGMYG